MYRDYRGGGGDSAAIRVVCALCAPLSDNEGGGFSWQREGEIGGDMEKEGGRKKKELRIPVCLDREIGQ